MIKSAVRKSILTWLTAILCVSGTTAEEPKASRLFGDKRVGSSQPSTAVGSYAWGCLAGAIQLPESGPTWQAMRLSRNRNWGHPVLIDFTMDLSEKARELGWKGLYVGDLSQPRGGPMTSGHRSHQIGLDVDVWMLPPERLNLTREERENISSISIRTEDQKKVNGNWTQTHMDILRTAAEDPRVDRIFVAAAAKLEMCKKAGSNRDWLQKIRPLAGHNYHFHVRLRCPDDGTAECLTQKPTVTELSNGGDGCDDTLEWWVTDYLELLKQPPDPDAPRRTHPRDYVMAQLPEQCQSVLDAPDS